MAINLFENQCVKINSKYSSESPSALPSRQLMKLSIATDSSIVSSDTKSIKTRKKSCAKSPYLSGDSVQMVSRITERKLYSQHKKSPDIRSSFPLAANIYKANSDEFKTQKKGLRKVKKSVLTLPNAPTAVPQTCTVSDMNDSEYYNGSDDNRKLKAKKRFLTPNKKPRLRNKDYEFYDRDARFCSQMNISLDCSSTDMITHFTGDCKNMTGKIRVEKPAQNEEFNAHDVWAVLRNINRFQFRPSPPVSEDSIPLTKKKRIRNRKRNNRKDTRIIETTCRTTEEFAYISSFEVDSKSPTCFSRTSSFDRITVIDKQDEFSEMCKEFKENIITKTKKNVKVKKYPVILNKNQNKKTNMRNNLKAVGHTEQSKMNEPQNKNINDWNTSLDTKESNLSKNNDGSRLMAMTHNTKVVKLQKPYPNENQGKSESVQMVINGVNELDNPLCSDSSKAGISATSKDVSEKIPKVSSDESIMHMKGITKVILNKGQSLMQPNKNETIKRKPRVVTVMPTTAVMPKLTQTEIKRRLANLKFPIVVLGKDQLTAASIQVMNNDFPHLESINQPVWPFMQKWFDPNYVRRDSEKDETNGKSERCNSQRNEQQGIELKNHLKKNHENIKTQYDKSGLNVDFAQHKKKYSKRPLPVNEISKIKSQSKKPMHQLKEKMLKLLYKNTSSKDIEEQNNIEGQRYSDHNVVHPGKIQISNSINKVHVGTDTYTNCECVPNGLSKLGPVSPRLNTKKIPVTKQPWAKAKWTSDLIETVMNKIRSGIYFNQESMYQQRGLKTNFKEACIQTVLSGENFSVIEKVVNEEPQQDDIIKNNEVVSYEGNNCLKTLPGFDDSFPALEVKTLNMKEVSVKYCTTNVMVQFDVALLSEPENIYPIKNKSSFISLATTESRTKIFKCKTTIVNAMLPAEICCLLPKIIRSIAQANKTQVLPPTTFPNEPLLYTISELSHCETPKPSLASLLPPVSRNISPTLSKLLNGVFTSQETRKKIKNAIPPLSQTYNSIFITKDLLGVSAQKLVVFKMNPIYFDIYKAGVKHIALQKYNRNSVPKINSCTTLDLYRESNPMLNMNFYTTINDLKNSWNLKLNILNRILTFSEPLDVFLGDNKITVTINKNRKNNGSSFINSKIKLFDVEHNIPHDSHFNGFLKRKNDAFPLKAIEYKNKTENKKEVKNHILTISPKNRKRSYVKLYKKCKSTSNISGERYSTSLSKIANLDDFFQALGAGKTLSSIFDGLSGKKLLSSILEMKNWITDISQRQAMLVLLLTNKKDTPNLVRFRPVLLQGIAVNRITRATELDMEIEVIEREHFNKFSQYTGIPCLTESVENDNLMEELYWIAKTTASDYQRPFNEASEKLLKSLLEKRKKLNPSYLRVMARYVGLGLLKSPKN